MKRNVVLIVTLSILIGFVLGFFLAGRIAHHRVKRMHESIDHPKKEKVRLMDRLDLSDSQKEVVGPMLDSFLIGQKELRHTFRKELREHRQDMFKTLEPELTDKQLKKLKRMKRRRDKKNRK